MKRVLSKSQMSRKRGGAWWHCKVVTKVTETECDIVLEGPEVDIEASSAIEAADMLHEKYGADQINCTSL